MREKRGNCDVKISVIIGFFFSLLFMARVVCLSIIVGCIYFEKIFSYVISLPFVQADVCLLLICFDNKDVKDDIDNYLKLQLL